MQQLLRCGCVLDFGVCALIVRVGQYAIWSGVEKLLLLETLGAVVQMGIQFLDRATQLLGDILGYVLADRIRGADG